MMSTDNADFFEVTCQDCKVTKSYFTAQGVNYFKLTHEGHKVNVKEPAAPGTAPAPAPAVVAPAPPPVVKVEEVTEVAEPEIEASEGSEDHSRMEVVVEEGPIRLGNLVVDVVDEGTGRSVKVYGIAGGHERFSKGFDMQHLQDLNDFLESGLYHDESAKKKYSWAPDKIDISNDVVRLLDEAPTPAEMAPAPIEPEVALGNDIVGAEAPSPAPEVEPATQVAPPQEAMPGDLILDERSFIKEGEANRLECARVSAVLRQFRWNIEPPYAIGAVFDDLLGVNSRTGMIKSTVIEAIKALGYDFIAVEAPNGKVTAWFKKKGRGIAESEILEFRSPSGLGQ
jgi:hypothetical protein